MEHGEHWLALRAAAREMGCSVVTLRRMIKRNKVQARRVHGPHGPAWEVLSSTLLSLPTVRSGELDQRSAAQPEQGAGDWITLVRELRAENATLHQMVGRLQAELSQAREQLALVPPAEPPEVAPSATPEPEATPEPAQRVWWRFW
jgi:hypothetical protein